VDQGHVNVHGQVEGRTHTFTVTFTGKPPLPAVPSLRKAGLSPLPRPAKYDFSARPRARKRVRAACHLTVHVPLTVDRDPVVARSIRHPVQFSVCKKGEQEIRAIWRSGV
jgi:hypothetical protein